MITKEMLRAEDWEIAACREAMTARPMSHLLLDTVRKLLRGLEFKSVSANRTGNIVYVRFSAPGLGPNRILQASLYRGRQEDYFRLGAAVRDAFAFEAYARELRELNLPKPRKPTMHEFDKSRWSVREWPAKQSSVWRQVVVEVDQCASAAGVAPTTMTAREPDSRTSFMLALDEAGLTDVLQEGLRALNTSTVAAEKANAHQIAASFKVIKPELVTLLKLGVDPEHLRDLVHELVVSTIQEG